MSAYGAYRHNFQSSAMLNPAGKVSSSVSCMVLKKGEIEIHLKQGVFETSIKLSADDAGQIAGVIQRAALASKGRA